MDKSYWSLTSIEALKSVESTIDGLSSKEAAVRLQKYGENTISGKKSLSQVKAFLNQFKNPIILILLFSTIISAITGDWFDAQIILVIVLASTILSFYQEYSAGEAIEKLKSKVQIVCTVKRDGEFIAIPARLVVPGDIVQLSGGELIPADGLLIESSDLKENTQKKASRSCKELQSLSI